MRQKKGLDNKMVSLSGGFYERYALRIYLPWGSEKTSAFILEQIKEKTNAC